MATCSAAAALAVDAAGEDDRDGLVVRLLVPPLLVVFHVGVGPPPLPLLPLPPLAVAAEAVALRRGTAPGARRGGDSWPRRLSSDAPDESLLRRDDGMARVGGGGGGAAAAGEALPRRCAR